MTKTTTNEGRKPVRVTFGEKAKSPVGLPKRFGRLKGDPAGEKPSVSKNK